MNRANRPRLSRISGSSYASKLLGRAGDGSTLTLDFTTGVLDPRLTFDRTSTATFINSSGLVQFANANLMTYSTPRSAGSAWAVTGTVTWGSATITDPFGNATAQEVTFGTAASAIFNTSGTTVVSGITHTFSVWLRAASGTTNVRIGDANVSPVTTVTLTTTWQRFSCQYVASGTNDGGAIYSQTGTPSSTFYVWGAQVQPGSIVGELLETTGTLRRNTPRFDHDPTTGSPRGLLIEGSAVNLFNFSEQFQQTSFWTSNLSGVTWPRATFVADTTTAPDGNNTADTFEEIASTSGTHRCRSNGITKTANQVFTVSVFVKNKDRGFFGFRFSDAGETNGCHLGFQLSGNGTVGTGVVFGSGYGTPTGTITPVGNSGWYRVTMTASTDTTTLFGVFLQLQDSINNQSYTSGATALGVYVWGAQLETGSGASSYIPTGASQGTRNADECSMTGTNFSSWFNATEGTFLAHARRMRTTDVGRIASANDNTANESIDIGASTTGQFIVTDGGSALATITPGTVTANTAFKIAGAFKLDDVQAALGGTLGTPDTGVTMPTVNQLMIGRQAGGSPVYLNGTVSLLKFWPTRLPNAQLQSLTT